MFQVGILLLVICSALTAYFATGIVRSVAVSARIVDRPTERKRHEFATPRLGGLAIIFGFSFPLLLFAGHPYAAELVVKHLDYLFAVIASGALIVALGVYDDLLGSNAPKKFAVQTAAALILVGSGFHFRFISIGGRTIEFGDFGIVISVIWIVGVINAVNFIDGIDSLATVVAVTTAVSFIIIAVMRGDAFSLTIMSALAGALVGFYPWNRPPAKIFMGDTGSMFIGLILAACSIARPTKSSTALLVAGPMLALALPVIDTLIVMKLRFAGPDPSVPSRIRRMFRADRRHIHHILVAKYGSVNRAILAIWGITLLFAAAAVLTVIEGLRWWGYGLAAVAAVLVFFLRHGPASVMTETNTPTTTLLEETNPSWPSGNTAAINNAIQARRRRKV